MGCGTSTLEGARATPTAQRTSEWYIGDTYEHREKRSKRDKRGSKEAQKKGKLGRASKGVVGKERRSRKKREGAGMKELGVHARPPVFLLFPHYVETDPLICPC